MNEIDQNQFDEHGQKHGHWFERHDDGDVWEGKFWKGKRYGYWMVRYANGGVEHKDYGKLLIPI